MASLAEFWKSPMWCSVGIRTPPPAWTFESVAAWHHPVKPAMSSPKAAPWPTETLVRETVRELGQHLGSPILPAAVPGGLSLQGQIGPDRGLSPRKVRRRLEQQR